MTSLETVLINTQNVRVIADSISLNKYVAFDLSVLNHNLLKNHYDSAGFENYIENYLTSHNAKVAYGGYNEERNLYQRKFLKMRNGRTQHSYWFRFMDKGRNTHFSRSRWDTS
jgi:hypothetical protein